MAQNYEYRLGELDTNDLLASPIEQLRGWLEAAKEAQIVEPTAMCVSTATQEGRPSARFVLLRALDERGVVFFSNYESRKGHELAANPFACATFWWATLERQVRVEGRVERTSPEESDAYFDSRPSQSKIASAASPQSQVVSNREELEAIVDALRPREGEDIRRPDHWGGYRIVPDRFEFWQGRPARLHDRLVYRLENGEWIIERLAP